MPSSSTAEKPAVSFNSSGVPVEMRGADRWLLWKYVTRKGASKPTKVPITAQGGPASSTDPKTWCSFDMAVKALEAGVHFASGVGFCFGDEWAGIEIDKCVVDGKLTNDARALVDKFQTYTEVSPGGGGIHLLVKSTKPLSSGATNKEGSVIATQGRFFTVTGRPVENSHPAVEYRTELLHALWTEWKSEQKPAGEWTEAPSTKFGDAVTKGAKEGARHATYTSVVGKMIREGMKIEDALKVALEINAKSNPPKPESVVTATVKDLYARYEDKDKKKKKWLVPFTTPTNTVVKDGLIFFDWEDYTIALSHFRDSRGGIEALAEIKYDATLKPLRINVRTGSASSLSETVRTLEHFNDLYDWRAILNHILDEMNVQSYAMKGVLAGGVKKLDEQEQYLIDNLLPANEITLVYGPGKSHKSYLALTMCIAVALGKELPGIKPVKQGNVLYLNFEGSGTARYQHRLYQIAEGLGLTEEERARLDNTLFYKSLTRALVDIIDDVKIWCSENNISMIVIDSFGAAAGSDPQEANSAIPLMTAVDGIRGVTKILISHVAKYELQERNGNGNRLFAYGSIYITNLSRITWEVVVGNIVEDQSADAVIANVAMFNREANYDMLLDPVGFRLRFHPMRRSTEVLLEVVEVNEDNGFVMHKSASQKDQILNLLSETTAAFKKGEIETEWMSTTDIADSLDMDSARVRFVCRQLMEKGQIEPKVQNATGGKGSKQAWRVKSDKEGFSEVHQ